MHEAAVPEKSDKRASAVEQRVFSDIQGPFEVPSMHGAGYSLSFIDDFRGLAILKYLVKKSDDLLKILEFVAEHEALKCMRTDNRIEYFCKCFLQIL